MFRNHFLFLQSILVMVSVLLTACGASTQAMDPALMRQAVLALSDGTQVSAYVSNDFLLPQGNWTFTSEIPVTMTAAALARHALWVMSDQVLVPMYVALELSFNPQAEPMSTFAANPTFDNFIKTIGPNMLQEEIEGPQKLFVGDKLLVTNMDGSVSTVQLASASDVQQAVETNANASQCQNEGGCLQSTPQKDPSDACAGKEKGLSRFDGARDPSLEITKAGFHKYTISDRNDIPVAQLTLIPNQVEGSSQTLLGSEIKTLNPGENDGSATGALIFALQKIAPSLKSTFGPDVLFEWEEINGYSWRCFFQKTGYNVQNDPISIVSNPALADYEGNMEIVRSYFPLR